MGFLNIFLTPLRQKTKPTVNINEDRENKLCNHQMRNFVFKYLCSIRYGYIEHSNYDVCYRPFDIPAKIHVNTSTIHVFSLWNHTDRRLFTEVPIPTLISDAQATQRLHISSMQFSPQPHVSVGSSLGKSCIATN